MFKNDDLVQFNNYGDDDRNGKILYFYQTICDLRKIYLTDLSMSLVNFISSN